MLLNLLDNKDLKLNGLINKVLNLEEIEVLNNNPEIIIYKKRMIYMEIDDKYSLSII